MSLSNSQFIIIRNEEGERGLSAYNQSKLDLAEKDHRLFNAQSDRNTNRDVFQQIKAQFEMAKDMSMMEDDEDEKNCWKDKIRIYSRDMSQHSTLGLNASDDHPPNLYVRTTPQFPNCGSGWERKRECLEVVVSYSGEARS